jgi:hypothetical protein
LTPYEFLDEECESVLLALNETLRHDYGPARSLDYFNECKTRLTAIQESIRKNPSMNGKDIADNMRSLSEIGSRISLIERSHLGEFSWPFAEGIRDIAETLFAEEQLDGSFVKPIMHTIAEGMGYHIVDEVPVAGSQRLVVVAFPRQFKHHVLLHSLFGHELGHTAFQSTGPGGVLRSQVLSALKDKTPLQDTIQATKWIRGATGSSSTAYNFSEVSLHNWCIEIACDLFGLMLFGPSFAAAHRAILEPLNCSPGDAIVQSFTHPSFPVRRRIISRAMESLGWHVPISAPSDGAVHDAEKALLDYAIDQTGGDWAELFAPDQISEIVARLKNAFGAHTDFIFDRPDQGMLGDLVRQLTLCRPPISYEIDERGIASNASVPMKHCLYAGWCFWFGRDRLQAQVAASNPLLLNMSFLEINRLCEYALLQQRAIDMGKTAGANTT